MIQVTLNFINLDAALKGLREIPENFLVGAHSAVPEDVKLPAFEKTEKVAAKKQTSASAKTAASSDTTPTPAPVEETLVEQAPAATESAAEVLDYKVLQKAVFALAGKNRAAVVELAGQFGVTTFKELDSSRWTEALAAINAALAEAA